MIGLSGRVAVGSESLMRQADRYNIDDRNAGIASPYTKDGPEEDIHTANLRTHHNEATTVVSFAGHNVDSASAQLGWRCVPVASFLPVS